MKTSNILSHCVAILTFIACTGFTPTYGNTPSAEEVISRLDRKADKMRKAIRNSKTTIDFKQFNTIYYIASDGDDLNDGLSPRTPIKSLDRLNRLDLKVGDCVLFHRGDSWRGRIATRDGVTYSAYGRGVKPQIYGSPCNTAEEGVWRETEVKNVYVYDAELGADIGTLVFNNGEACAFKVMMNRQKDGTTLHIETREPFASYRDLKRDLEFYHDYRGAKRVYLYSAEGNPAERFASIELLVKGNIIQAEDNVHIDNLCIKYGGAHGVGSLTTKGLRVTNCEFGWIGGSIQGEDLFGRSTPTRYGNAIEIYGGCENFVVDNCYIYQIYDAAITHQHQGDTEEVITMKNVTYSNNLVEDCVYSIEYFLSRADISQAHYMENILICDNLLRRSGFGWGKQRPDKNTPAHIKSWGHHYNRATNFVVRDNIFDRGTHDLLNISANKAEWLPTLTNNTYIQHRGGAAGLNGTQGVTYTFDEKVGDVMRELFGESKATIVFIEE
ncbi:MAG: hypothetical protein IKV12_02165 [Alistipes sp.]|nr:hypothetical protein [Alistipes sp.]